MDEPPQERPNKKPRRKRAFSRNLRKGHLNQKNSSVPPAAEQSDHTPSAAGTPTASTSIRHSVTAATSASRRYTRDEYKLELKSVCLENRALKSRIDMLEKQLEQLRKRTTQTIEAMRITQQQNRECKLARKSAEATAHSQLKKLETVQEEMNSTVRTKIDLAIEKAEVLIFVQ